MRYGTLKPGELALLLNVHPATIRKMVRQGRLKPLQAGSQRRFSLAEARRALAQRMLGRKPTGRKEVSQMVVRWAAQRLGLSAIHGAS
jgi:excisionase family DNA binding protein